jgi:hypothetical protein
MKTYLLKCEKWNSTNLSIFWEGQKVGTFFPGMFSSVYKLLLGEKEFDVRKRNAFNNSLSIYSQGKLLADVQNYPFKNRSIITTVDKKEYVIKSNTWNNRCVLSGSEGLLGESHHKLSSTTLSFNDSVDDLIITAVIAQTQLKYETSMMIAFFTVVFVVIIAT